MELDYKALAAGLASAALVAFAHAQPADKSHGQDRDGKPSQEQSAKAKAIDDRPQAGK